MANPAPLSEDDLEVVGRALKQANELLYDTKYKDFTDLLISATILRPGTDNDKDVLGDFVFVSSDLIGFKPWGIE